MARECLMVRHSLLTAISRLKDAEVGRLFRAMLIYSMTDGAQSGELSGCEEIIWPIAQEMIDRDITSYAETVDKRSKAGQVSANRRQQQPAPSSTSQQEATPVNASQPTPTSTPTPTSSPTSKSTRGSGGADAPPPTRAAGEKKRHKHGEYGWVRLTDEEYKRLVADFGEAEVERCIAYVDEAAQSTGNKNGWKDWNVTVRKCARGGWGKSSGKPGKNADRETNNPFVMMAMEARE